MTDQTPEVNFDAVSKVFSGETSDYSVIATRGAEAIGVSIDYEADLPTNQGYLTVRFATFTNDKNPQVFKYFTPRSRALFDRGEPTSFFGIRLNKMQFPIFSRAVNPYKALEVGNSLGTWDEVGAWLGEILAQEGFTATVLSLPNFVRSEVTLADEAEAEEPGDVFQAVTFVEHAEMVIPPNTGGDDLN